MPLRKDTTEWKTDSRGRYRRMIGWREDGGKRVQQPFYLGSDLDQAKARYVRVKELWAYLEQRREQSLTKLNSSFELPEPTECKWDEESLLVARELAAGRVQITVPFTGGGPETSHVSKIDRLAKRYPMIHFVPEEPDAYQAGMSTWQLYINGEQGRLPLPLANVASKVTSTFHEALDKYIENVKKTALEPTADGPKLTAFGHVKIEQARRIKARQKDRPLSTLDLQGCQELLDYWRMRPLTEATKKRPPRPMEVRYCENHIAELNRFFRWLHKDKNFDWRKPEDFDDLVTKVKELPEERTNIDFLNVEVFTIEQLAILNKYATPLERVLLLLGLNCGFKGAEAGTLRFEHLFLDKPHPHAATIRERTGFELRPEDQFVLYSRNKSKVYGEFLLWQQTVDALRWATDRQKRICELKGIAYSQLLLTERGVPFYHRTTSGKNQSQIFINKWAGLLKRVRKDYPDFPTYSFTTLRDTAADRIRRIAGGEVAAVFLMHGRPVRKDDLLDLYTNRPFGEVFKALRKFEEELRPVFEAAPDDPWETPMQQYTSLGVREKMIALYRAGVKPTEIARQVGKSHQTVYKLIERLHSRPKKLNRSS